ncbi:hypothetical protein ACFY30_06285 [Streptomyces sp. NPDC000345]|uniref:hypothetical protein n=1 Tax=Streptomyces sp. NPDC000345 TaxID=3364537 RepID=UPI00367E1022
MVGAPAFDGVAFGVTPYVSMRMQTLLGMSPVRGGLTLLRHRTDVPDGGRPDARGGAHAGGGGAAALRGVVPEHGLRAARAAGLDTALVTAGRA